MVQEIYNFKYILLSILILISFSSFSKTITGNAVVVDGDTLKIGIYKIRLHGIDAPEIKQTCYIEKKEWKCGEKAKESLSNLSNLKKVRCLTNQKDQYNRYIAVCYINNLNINKWMVENGWAIAYRYYSMDYVKNEEIANKNKAGIWEGEFIKPYIFRKRNN